MSRDPLRRPGEVEHLLPPGPPQVLRGSQGGTKWPRPGELSEGAAQQLLLLQLLLLTLLPPGQAPESCLEPRVLARFPVMLVCGPHIVGGEVQDLAAGPIGSEGDGDGSQRLSTPQ